MNTVGEEGQALLDLSRRMLVAAQEGDWEQVQMLEAQRHVGVVALAEGRQPDDPEWERVLTELVELDKEIIRHVAGARQELAATLAQFATRRGAVSAYDENLRHSL